MHKHRCGFGALSEPLDYVLTPVSMLPRGCGHEWEHEGKDVPDIGEPAALEAHKCPSCGAGPWALHCRPETEKAIEELSKLGERIRESILR